MAITKKKNPKEGSKRTTVWQETDKYTLRMENGKVVCPNNNYVVCIEKDPQKDFVILNFADIQVGEVEMKTGAVFYTSAIATIKKLIKKVQPDLIITLGDQGYGEESIIRHFGSLIDSFGIPWAPTLGNHDNYERDCKVSYQADLYEGFSHCLFRSGPINLASVYSGSEALGNYIVNIVEKDDSPRGFSVVRTLILFHGGDDEDYDKKDFPGEFPVNATRYQRLSQNQLDWYTWAVKNVQAYGKKGFVPTAIFLHMPIYHYAVLAARAYNTPFTETEFKEFSTFVRKIPLERTYNDPTVWTEAYKGSYGAFHEDAGCGCPPYDDHALSYLVQWGNIKRPTTDLCLCGHDHMNNFVIKDPENGITFAYGTSTGIDPGNDPELNGGTVVTIKKDGDFDIRHEYIKLRCRKLAPWMIGAIVGGGVAALTTLLLLTLL